MYFYMPNITKPMCSNSIESCNSVTCSKCCDNLQTNHNSHPLMSYMLVTLLKLVHTSILVFVLTVSCKVNNFVFAHVFIPEITVVKFILILFELTPVTVAFLFVLF
jgi:hypothetical protein